MSNNRVLLLAGHVMTLTLFRMELIERLLADGWRVTVGVPLDGEENPFSGCDVVDIPVDRRGTNPLKDIQLFLRYWQIMKRLKPYVVLTHTVKPNLYGGMACILNGVRQLADVTGLGSGFSHKGLVSAFVRMLSKFVFRRADTVFVENASILSILEERGMLRGNGVLIPGSGVNLTRFAAAPYPAEDAPVIFHFVARVMREKGIQEYLDAARRIRAVHPEATFRVIGPMEESEWEPILQAAQTAGDIEYWGYRNDIPLLTAECACIVNPTYHEGMSNVLQESAACARPVIASDIPGCRECVEDGVTGLLCQARNADSLVEAITRFLALSYERRVRMGQAGRTKMEREFDRGKVVAAYTGRLGKLAGNNPIRVLHVVGRMNRGGAETLIMNLYRCMDRSKIQFDFMVHTNDACAYDDEIKSLGGLIYHITPYRVINHFDYKKRWERFLSEHGEFTFIHGHITSTAVIYLSMANKKGIKTIAHAHNTKTVHDLSNYIKHLWKLRLKKVPDYLFACSRAAGLSDFGVKACDSARFSVVKNAIHIDDFLYNAETRRIVRERLKIVDKFVVGHVGRFYKPKNHEFLIDVFKKIHEKNKNAVLLLIGDGPLKEATHQQIKKLGLEESVILTGSVSNTSEMLCAMDVFAFPSLYEGLGIVLIEAQANGLRCVSSSAVPDEAKATTLLERISLKNPTTEWAEKILVHDSGYTRKDMKNDIRAVGYDINEVVEWLSAFYMADLIAR